MNKCIKRLVESLFDDDFDDIVNHNHNDEVTTIGRKNDRNQITIL